MSEPRTIRAARGSERNLPLDIRINVDKTAWMEQARCLGADPSVEDAEQAREFVRAHCRRCPVVAVCLDYGIKIKANSIVYGGTYFNTDGVPNERWAQEPKDPRCA